MIFGEEEAAILAYCNDDEPKSAEKTRFGRVWIIFPNLGKEQSLLYFLLKIKSTVWADFFLLSQKIHIFLCLFYSILDKTSGAGMR